MQKTQKGFTIIELIVVIAIIAVLATIVMINVTQYIAKGKDASIQGNLANVLTNAAVVYDASSTYSGLCNDPAVKAAIAAIDTTEGGTAGAKTDCVPNGTAGWFACAQLIKDNTKYFCVDSTGAKTTVTGTCGALTLTACPAS